MNRVVLFLRRYGLAIFLSFLILFGTGVVEWSFGRLPLGPDGRFGWWEGSVWSSENSQRVADAYSFSHIIHGMLFYALLWLVARKWPMRYRFAVALLLEALWEILENSPIIINRYREATISVGYEGDSILNSLCDIGMVVIGFGMARISRVWVTIALIVAMEVGCLFWVRDNLTLNVLMLVYPSETVKTWQSEGH